MNKRKPNRGNKTHRNGSPIARSGSRSVFPNADSRIRIRINMMRIHNTAKKASL